MVSLQLGEAKSNKIKQRESAQLKQILYQMDKNAKTKPPSETLTKSLDSLPDSITEAFCPKYRKFVNFNKQTNFQSKQILPETQSQQPNQQSGSHAQLSNQQISPKVTSKHQFKSSHSVSMIDINESTQMPPLDDKQLSIQIQPYNKESSNTQAPNLSPLPHLKLRKQFTSKIRSRDGSMNEDELKYQIKDHFNQLNSIIDKTSTHFDKRMKTHEDELLKIMMMQIKRVNEECQKTIRKYNELIRSKASNQQIDEARLETMFFRSQVLELKKENQDLKKEIKYLKRLNNEYELKIKTDWDSLKQMGIKLMSYKEKNKSIQRTLLDEVIAKKTEKIKQLNSEKHSNLKIQPNQQSVLEGSKISCIRKLNSKSLDNTDLTEFRSPQKSLGSMRMRTEFVSGASSNPSLTNSLAMKLNREINNKYKIGKDVHEFCAQTSTDRKQQLQDITQNNEGLDQSANREKIMKFLKEARPSIKSIIQQKKTNDKRPIRKLTHEPSQKEHQNIIMIKNRVRLSTFQQQRWQEFKNNSIVVSHEHQLSQTTN